jgi:hypothetical protein
MAQSQFLFIKTYDQYKSHHVPVRTSSCDRSSGDITRLRLGNTLVTECGGTPSRFPKYLVSHVDAPQSIGSRISLFEDKEVDLTLHNLPGSLIAHRR